MYAINFQNSILPSQQLCEQGRKNASNATHLLNNERMSLGSTGITIVQSQWDREKERVKGRHTEALNTNLQLYNIQSGLQAIFRKLEMTDELSLERIKSEHHGKNKI